MSLGFTNKAPIKALTAKPAHLSAAPSDIELVDASSEPPKPKGKKAKKVKTIPTDVAKSAPKAAKPKKRLVVKVHVKSPRLRSLLKLDKPAA